MKRSTTWMIAALVLAGAAGPALAQGPPGPPRPPHERLGAMLGLTSEQQAAWDAARRDADPSLRGLHEQASGLRREIGALLDQPGPDAALVGQRMIALHEIEGRARKAREALDEKLVALLTPEQKTKYEAFKAAMPHPGAPMPGMGPGMSPHGRPGAGPGRMDAMGPGGMGPGPMDFGGPHPGMLPGAPGYPAPRGQ
jgi:Spy/CpxP family protein refolding chaperone